MNVEPVTLTGPTVRLEPLTLDHADGLWRASSPDLFAYMWSWEHTGTPQDFRQVVQNTLNVPDWLSFDAGSMTGRIASLPTREQINLPVQEQLIVELYSK